MISDLSKTRQSSEMRRLLLSFPHYKPSAGKLTMRFLALWIAGLLLCVCGAVAPTLAYDDPTAAQHAEIARRYGLDPASELKSRVRETPAEVLKMFAEDGQTAPTAHVLTDGERRELASAFATLPPLHQRVLRERLRSVNFLDGMPNTALTSTVNPGASFRLFDITIRAAILRQNVSEWLTEKERSCFDATDSPLSVSIEAGKRDALAYVLLHEATHIVDMSLGLTPPLLTSEKTAGSVPPTAFTAGVWQEHATPAPPYRDPLRERVRFRAGGGLFGMDQAAAVYTSLRGTPFVSLYGSSNWNEDLAEYVAVYHWTAALKQPYRIVIRKNGKSVFVYEPMKSNLVRSRGDQMQQFYAQEALAGAR